MITVLRSKKLLFLSTGFGALFIVALYTGLSIWVGATSAVELPPPPLPTATPQPNASLPKTLDGLVSQNPTGPVAQTALSVSGTGSTPNLFCDQTIHWTLTVNQADEVGHPLMRLPSTGDWSQAWLAVSTARSLCLAPLTVIWVGHASSPTQNRRWTARLSVTELENMIDASSFRRVAERSATTITL